MTRRTRLALAITSIVASCWTSAAAWHFIPWPEWTRPPALVTAFVLGALQVLNLGHAIERMSWPEDKG